MHEAPGFKVQHQVSWEHWYVPATPEDRGNKSLRSLAVWELEISLEYVKSYLKKTKTKTKNSPKIPEKPLNLIYTETDSMQETYW